ncbi:MAG: cytochrome c oxidase assembly protein [Porticoccaceae bacterium]|nr:cytochrome c oxidase assembly protein [Porticoccaceae bacterium]
MATAVHKTLIKLSVGAVVMFAFAMFAMPPLYTMFCEVTGIGINTGEPYVATEAGIDESRTVRVQFVTTNNAEMPWQFAPSIHEVRVHPGEPTPVTFWAHNTTDNDMVGQAIPNVAPFNAAQYFHKTECFCFNNQPLAAGEKADLPLVFIVDPDLPPAVKTITLSYTMFDITDRQSGGPVAATTN